MEESSSSAGGNLVSAWENERTGSVEPTTDNNCENEDLEEGMKVDVLEKRGNVVRMREESWKILYLALSPPNPYYY